MASALLAAPVVAASFDCGKARTTVERLICSNPIVSALDDSLALAYTQALELASDADELRRQQRDWLSKRRNICTTIECLLHVYGRRLEDIEDLNRWIPVPPLATTPLTAAENAACQNVVDYANNSNLRDLRVQTNYPLPNALEFDEIFGSSLGIYDFNSYWSIDIDDDGTLDHMLVAIRDGMSAIAVARRNVKGAKTEIVDDFERGNDMISVLQIASRYYVLSERYDYGLLPGSLWMWRTGGNLERLCDFEEIDPAITLMPNSIHHVCKADQANKTVGIEYPHAHSIDALPRDIFTDVFAKPGMARADLDNDGR
ncbi:MAG: DUF1311 domain-containing protein [Burkholderiales bacterium]|nr:DUF1311 domain-containing protein [Burkholderiales bacterium]